VFKNKISWILISLVVVLSMIFSFTLVNCKGSEETAEEMVETTEGVAETTESVKEETQEDKTMDEITITAAKKLAEGRDVTLKLCTTNDPPGSALEKVIPEWENATGIKITVERLSTIEQSQRVNLELMAGKSEFDIINYDACVYKPVLENPGVIDLDPYIEKYNPHFETMIPKLEEWCMRDNGSYAAIPFYWSDYVMVYRKDLIDDPKEHEAFKAKYGYDYDIANLTWDKSYPDLAEFFTRDTNNDGEIDFWGSSEMFTPVAGCDAFMSQYLNRWDADKELIADPKTGKSTLDDEATRQTLQTYVDMNKKGCYVPDILQLEWSNILGSFGSGRSALSFQYAPTWMPIQNKTDEFKISGPDLVGFAYVPGIEGKPRSVEDCGYVSFITKSSSEPELSYLFMLWATSEKIDKEMTLTGLHNPIRQASYKDPEIQVLNPIFATEFLYPDNLVQSPAHLIYEEEALIISNYMAALIGGSIDVEGAVKGICKEIDAKWAEVKTE